MTERHSLRVCAETHKRRERNIMAPEGNELFTDDQNYFDSILEELEALGLPV